jgi:hypothetical protein
MKSNAKPSLYFSAYPLKVIKDPSADNKPDSPYLKALLSGKSKSGSRTRVFPMMHPYKGTPNPVSSEADKLPTDIELTEKNWFTNYE